MKPQRNIDIIVNSGAGGAADGNPSRAEISAVGSRNPSVSVTNRVGGGHYRDDVLTQHPGDAHYIGVLSTGLLTNHIVGQSNSLSGPDAALF